MSAGVDREAQKRGIRKTVAVLVGVVALVVGLQVYKVTREPPLDREALRAQGTVVFDQPRQVSDFELLDQRGEAFTPEDLEGTWTLAFFGFTHCPDICPTTMAELSRMVGELTPERAANTQVLLVTLDPARDTPAVLAEYLAYFHEDFVGVTGEFLPLKRFANEVNIAFAKVNQGDDYTIDHSSQVVLFNPKGDYHGFFKPPFDPSRLAEHYRAIAEAFPY